MEFGSAVEGKIFNATLEFKQYLSAYLLGVHLSTGALLSITYQGKLLLIEVKVYNWYYSPRVHSKFFF